MGKKAAWQLFFAPSLLSSIDTRLCVCKSDSLSFFIFSFFLRTKGSISRQKLRAGKKIWKGKGRDVECGPFFNGEDLTCHIGSFVGKVMLKNIIYKAIIFSF